MDSNNYTEDPNVIQYRNPCFECGLPINCYEELGLCDQCAEAKIEEEEQND